MKNVAKLVTISLLTRVIVDENATDEQILQTAKRGFQAKLDNNELNENLESIVDDTECPYGTLENDGVDNDGITDEHIKAANKIFSASMVISPREAIRLIIQQARKEQGKDLSIGQYLLEEINDDIELVSTKAFSLYSDEFLSEIDYKL